MKGFVLLLTGCSVSIVSAGQNLQSAALTNDFGIYTTLSNPANASGTTDKLSINLAGFGAGFENTLYKTRFSYSAAEILSMQPKRDKQPELSDPFFRLDARDMKKPAFYVNAQVLLPSVKYNISPDLSVFCYLRDRATGNLDKTTAATADFLANEAYSGNPVDYNIRADVRLLTFHENAFGIAGTLYNKGEHYLKAGITLKQISSAYMYMMNITEFTGSAAGNTVSLMAKYRVVESNTDNISSKPFDWLSGKHNGGKGYGMDMGFVYEYRPYKMRHRYKVNNPRGKNKNFRQRDLIKYRYRLSFALSDIGRIHYASNISDKHYELAAAVPVMYADSLRDPAYRKTILEKAKLVSEQHAFSSSLPATALFAIDYRLTKEWFCAVSYRQNLKQRNEWGSIYSPSRISCLLRKEMNQLTYGVPLNIVPATRSFNIGGLIKAGPLFFGTDNIRSLVSKQMYNVSLYAGILVNIRYRRDPTIETFRAF